VADQYYIEEGYLEAGYFAYVADASASLSTSATLSCSGDIADDTGYFIPDYIQTDYITAGGVTQEASASLSASASVTASADKIKQGASTLSVAASATATGGTTKQASASIDGVLTFSAVAVAQRTTESILSTVATISTSGVKTARTDVTLSNIVNLSLQADKTVGFAVAISAASGLTVDATIAEFATATLNSAATLEIAAQIANQRPRPYVTVNSPTINTSNSVFGGASARVGANKQVQYYDSADYKTAKTWDFWFKPDSFTTNQNCVVFLQQDDVSTDDFFLIKVLRLADSGADTQWRIIIKTRVSGTVRTYTSSTYTNWTAFKHIRVERGTSAYHLWVDGSSDTPSSDTTTGAYPNINNSADLGRNFDNSADGIGFVDELYISTQLLVATDTSSFTTPTEAYALTTAQQNNTVLLAHFDTDFSDDVSEYFYGEAALSASASLTADGVRTASASSTLNTVASLTADVAEIEQGAATLNSAATLSTAPVKTVSATVDISGAASFSVTTIAINPGDAYLETTATLSVDAVAQVGGTVSASAAASLSVDASRTRSDSASISSAASLTVDAIKSVEADATLNITATLSATPGRTVTGTASLSALAATVTVGERQPPRMRLAAWLNTNNTYAGAGTVYDAYNNFYALGVDIGNGSDFVLVKANAIGDLQWQKSYTNYIDYATYHELHYYNDHIYVLSGSTYGTSNETDDRTYITKISITDGSVAQARQLTIASLKNSRIRNGYLYIAGNSISETYETRVVRIDLSDLTTNDLSIDLDIANYDFFETYIDANASGDIFLATHAQPNGTTERVTFLTKLASDGSHTVSKLIDYTGYSVQPLDAELDSQGRFLVYISSNAANAQGIIQFDSSLNSYGWMRNVESDTDNTDYLKIAVDGDDNVIIINQDTRKVVVLDNTGTKVANYYDEAIASDGSQVAAKDEWYLTVGDGYWRAFPQSSDYDEVRNIWVTQTLVEDEDNPIYAPEDYAGSDGIFTYESSNVTVSSASVSPSSVTLASNTQTLTNSTFNVTASDTTYTWRILARLIAGFADDINAVATLYQDSTEARIRLSGSTQSAVASLSATGDRIRFAESTQSAVATVAATGGLLRPGAASISAVATLSASAERTRDNEFVLDASAVFNSSPERIRDPGATTISTSATLSVSAVKTTSTTVDIDGVMSFSAVANARRTTETQLETSATVSATPNLTAVVSSVLDTAATLEVTAFNTVSFDLSASASATLSVDVDRIRPGAATMSAAASIDEVTVSQTKGFELVTDAEFTLASSVTRIQPAGSGLNTAASLTVVGNRIRFSSAELDAQFDPFYANAYRVVSAEVDLSAFVVTVTAGDVIAIDPFRTLLIPQESRQLKILEEDRDLTIEQETRVLVI